MSVDPAKATKAQFTGLVGCVRLVVLARGGS
jgi:hypothetical protein